jgi:amino acid adenylation domain-containing protein
VKEDNNSILINRILDSAFKHQDNYAVEIGDKQYTYAELLLTAGQISKAINDNSNDDEVVAIIADKSFCNYAGILGILLSSSAYLPLNPRFPLKRNREIIDSAGVKTLVVTPGEHLLAAEVIENSENEYNIICCEKVDADKNPFNDSIKLSFLDDVPEVKIPEVKSASGDIAYLLYTSGSTGRPKGVPVSNRNVTAYLDAIVNNYDLKPTDRFSHTFDLTFDLSVHDMFVCWSVGGCLVVPQDNSTFSLFSYLKKKSITVWFSVPSVIVLLSQMKLLKAGTFESVRLSFFCGEPLLTQSVSQWSLAAPFSRIINLYGPTEATIAISGYEILGEEIKSLNDIVSIGKIFPGHDKQIISEEENEPGELHVAGPQVVDSYYHDEAITAEAFYLKDNINWYKTGDLVIEDDDGDLYFAGRSDSEVKIGGYRVNLLEIDHKLRQMKGIAKVCNVLDPKAARGMVVCFVEVLEGTEPSEGELVSYCSQVLPWYMVPERFIFVEEMPLNPNGKTDKKKLKELI